MTDEEKKAAEAAEAEAKAKATAAAGGGEPSQNNNADTEAALKVERERREKAERELEETRKKAREASEKRKHEREAAGLSPEDEDDKPLTRRETEQLLSERETKVRKEMLEDRALLKAQELSLGNETEATLILETWKNRTLAGTLEEQIEEAHAIATRKRMKAQNEELKRALAGEESVVTDGANPQRKPAGGASPVLSAEAKSVLVGYTWDVARNAYRKKIAGGRKILFVAKDLKKSWAEDAPKEA